MKIKQLLALLLIGLAIGACKRPDGGEDSANVDPEGKLVEAKLAIKMPKSIRTYAPGGADPNATEDEIEVNRIDVFIYQNGGSYALDYFYFDVPRGTSAPLTGDHDFRIEENGVGPADDVFETQTFQVREGEKLIYVGLNLPNLILNRLKSGYYINEVFEADNLIDELAAIGTETGGGSREVAFFSANRLVQNITDAIPASDAIPVNVSRLVAKVVVKAVDEEGDEGEDAAWEVNGGMVSDLEFAIGQRNNQMFVRPLLDIAGTAEDLAGVDPNHAVTGVGAHSLTSPLIQILQDVDNNDYISVNDVAASAGTRATHMRYATENTALTPTHQDVTYVSIRAKFTPHRWGADPATGQLPAGGVNTSPTAAGFYAVFTGDDSDGLDGLGVRYFNATNTTGLDSARNFVMGAYFSDVITDGGGTPPINDNIGDAFTASALSTEADHYIHFYPQSYCYYRVYLNPTIPNEGSGTSTHGTGAYNILRNTVYIATITGMNYIGTTGKDILPGSMDGNGKGTPTYPGDWFPNPYPLSAAILPSEEIEARPDWRSGLSVTLTLNNWVPDSQDYETY